MRVAPTDGSRSSSVPAWPATRCASRPGWPALTHDPDSHRGQRAGADQLLLAATQVEAARPAVQIRTGHGRPQLEPLLEGGPDPRDGMAVVAQPGHDLGRRARVVVAGLSVLEEPARCPFGEARLVHL